MVRRARWTTVSALLLVACSGAGGYSPVSTDGAHSTLASDLDATATNPDLMAVGCPLPQTICGGACVDLGVDAKNCGACGHVCAPTEQCSAGSCASPCSAGEVACSSVCVNLLTDPNHCGQCSDICPQGQRCAAGICQVPTLTGCHGAIACTNGCQDQACASMCMDDTTAAGKVLLTAVFACLEKACPSTKGGICDMAAPSYNVTNCLACYSDAQMANGSCVGALNACMADMP